MIKPGLFSSIFIIPILNVLVAFYVVFSFLRIPFALGFAIITLTFLVRFLLQPFFNQQMQTAKKMQDIKPQLDILTKKHKGDKKMIQQEQLKLYQQAGINPAAGCLFMIVQIPVFIALYRALLLFLHNGDQSKVIADINNVLYSKALYIKSIDPNFFGLNLAASPQTVGNPIYFLVPVVTAALQYYQVKVSTPIQSKSTPAQPNVPSTDKKGSQEDFQKAMTSQMKYVFPLLIGWFAYTLPVGLSLYWNVFSLFSIIQYRKLNK